MSKPSRKEKIPVFKRMIVILIQLMLLTCTWAFLSQNKVSVNVKLASRQKLTKF